MATASIGGSSAAMDWTATYDDVAHTLVVQGSGPGRCTVIVEQADGKRAAAQFVQASGPASVPIPVPDDVIPTLAVQPVTITAPGSRTFSPITLKAFPPSKPSGQGTFKLVGSEANMG